MPPEVMREWYSQIHVGTKEANVSPQNIAIVDRFVLVFFPALLYRLETIKANNPKVVAK